MENDVVKIITDGVTAPSGENCQPWRFEIEHAKVKIFNMPEKDLSLYNSGQRGSMVAHGALIENMVISAKEFNYETKVEVLPDEEQPDLTAVITFRHNGSLPKDYLYRFMRTRHTNRKKYQPGKKITDRQKQVLLELGNDLQNVGTNLLEDNLAINKIAEILSINDRIIFENKAMHSFFYNHLLWREKDQYTAGGFYIKTLELDSQQLKGVKLLKNWQILKILNKMAGISKKIAKENATRYASSSGIAYFPTNMTDNASYIAAGRKMQRFWLKATSLGISVQPCTGVFFLYEYIQETGGGLFSSSEKEMIIQGYKEITSILKLDNKKIPMLFRLGFSDAPTSVATRLTPSINIKQI